MSSNRKLVFGKGEYYHVFNRGVEKRHIFTSLHEYTRALDTIRYYRFFDLPLKYSKYISLEIEKRKSYIQSLNKLDPQIEVVAYCLMPNHFHMLLKQIKERGIISFVSKFSNSYTKYFNTKHERVGPLLQGVFKAVHIDDDEQLLHVSRYIHLNPVLAFLISKEELPHYIWSSFPQYSGTNKDNLTAESEVLSFFKTRAAYEEFVLDQADYSLSLKKIEHLMIDEE